MFPDGRTDKVLEQDEIIFFQTGRDPVHIHMVPSLEGRVDAYYPFLKAYTFKNNAKGLKDRRESRTLRHRLTSSGEIISFGVEDRSFEVNSAFILLTNGEIRKVKVPDVFISGYGVAVPTSVVWE